MCPWEEAAGLRVGQGSGERTLAISSNSDYEPIRSYQGSKCRMEAVAEDTRQKKQRSDKVSVKKDHRCRGKSYHNGGAVVCMRQQSPWALLDPEPCHCRVCWESLGFLIPSASPFQVTWIYVSVSAFGHQGHPCPELPRLLSQSSNVLPLPHCGGNALCASWNSIKEERTLINLFYSWANWGYSYSPGSYGQKVKKT